MLLCWSAIWSETLNCCRSSSCLYLILWRPSDHLPSKTILSYSLSSIFLLLISLHEHKHMIIMENNLNIFVPRSLVSPSLSPPFFILFKTMRIIAAFKGNSLRHSFVHLLLLAGGNSHRRWLSYTHTHSRIFQPTLTSNELDPRLSLVQKLKIETPITITHLNNLILDGDDDRPFVPLLFILCFLKCY